MSIVLHLTAVAMLGSLQTPDPKYITGTLSDRIVPEAAMAHIELRESTDRGLPGVSEGDRVFRARTPQFRPPGMRDGLSVAWVESAAGTYLYIDKDLDGRLTASERMPHTGSAPLQVELTSPAMSRPLPFECRILKTPPAAAAEPRRGFLFSATYRIEGHADIAGRKTLVSLPFRIAGDVIDVKEGKLGVDANGDGKIDFLHGLREGEVMFARGERVIFRVGGKYVSFESADMSARRFVLREHAAEEYTIVEIRTGVPLPDFSFTDFDGKARKLSDFRGKYVLIDVWGSWCKPCVEDLPKLKAAYDQFKDKGLEILGIDYENSAAVDQVRALLKEKNVTWTNALPTSVKELVRDRWRIMSFPTLFLLDPNGVVIQMDEGGALRGQRLAATLERALEKR